MQQVQERMCDQTVIAAYLFWACSRLRGGPRTWTPPSHRPPLSAPTPSHTRACGLCNYERLTSLDSYNHIVRPKGLCKSLWIRNLSSCASIVHTQCCVAGLFCTGSGFFHLPAPAPIKISVFTKKVGFQLFLTHF